MKRALQLLAGSAARRLIEERGLRPEDVDIVVGASGGPKWLVLNGLDRVLFGQFLGAPRARPLHLIGSSIGAWRMAALAQDDPIAALDRFEQAYIDEQHYSAKPSAAEITRMSVLLLDRLLGVDGTQEILSNSQRHLHVITARCRGFAASERRSLQLAALAVAAFGNLVHRASLRAQFERVVFDAAGDSSPFRGLADFPTRHVALTSANLRGALLASGAIPLILEGVRIPDAPPGVYRDGGVIDYHPDLDFGSGDGLVLYPHFYSHVVPGWFDKSLSWRRRHRADFSRVVLLAPTPEFVATLPGGRIPDRKDFYRYAPAERQRRWHAVCAASRRLGDEFLELTVSGRWNDVVRPLT